jgi:ATP-dependent exoDNAse (exonuclease V) alpha subunit
VINGTLATVTAIDRERGDLLLRTMEPDPRDVRQPATFWNAKGRRRVSLAYCRTIHKSQGSTYRGESFTLAGDDTIHLEAVHVALSRGKKANHLYYTGEPPPHEDHHLPAVAEPALENLVAAAGRSRAQVMALDLLEAAGAADARTERRRQREAWAAASRGASAPEESAVAPSRRAARLGP